MRTLRRSFISESARLVMNKNATTSNPSNHVEPATQRALAKSLALLAALLTAAFGAQAQLTSSESFNGYTVGTQLPANTPSPTVAGYSGNWTGVDFGTQRPSTIAGSLSYGGAGYAAGAGDCIGVPNNTTGGEITSANSGRMYRLLDSSLTVTASTTGTRYMSFLYQNGRQTGAATYQMLHLQNGTGDGAANRRFAAGLCNNSGQSGNQYNFSVNEAYTSTGLNADTGAHLFVVKFVLSATAASDSVTVWIDPALGGGEPAGGITVSAVDFLWDRLAFSDYEGNSCAWDEVRWGTTFASVTSELAVSLTALSPSNSVYAGTAVTASATASLGTAPYTYQWQVNTGSGFGNITDATNSTYVINTTGQEGTAYAYRMIATDDDGATGTSGSAALTVSADSAPTVTVDTAFTRPVTPLGDRTVVSATFAGTPTVFYQWQYSTASDGSGATNIPSVTSSSYAIANAVSGNAGYYRLVASNHVGVASSSWAQLQVSAGQLYSFEPFASYTTGTELPSDLPSQAVTGYSGNWADVAFGDAEPAISAGSLVYGGGGYAAGTGDKVSKGADIAGIGADNSGRTSRLLDASLTVPHGTTRTIYLSWLFKTGNENAAAQPNVYQTLALWNGDAGNDGLRDFEAGIAVGDFGAANYGFRVDNATAANLGVSPDANVHLLVAKFVLNAASLSDSVTVWIDPALGAGEPTGGVTLSGKDIAFDRLALSDYASDSSAWDEVRWGDSFNSVTIFHAPTAADLDLGVTAGGSTTATVIGKFAPATDGDGDAVSVSAVTQGASGTVTFNGTTVTYANTAAAATDSFTYTVSDGKGATAIRTVNVLITAPEGFNKLSGPTGTGPYSFSYLGIPGEGYALEETADLPATASSVWTTVATETATPVGAVNFTGVTLSHPSGSFRTRHVP